MRRVGYGVMAVATVAALLWMVWQQASPLTVPTVLLRPQAAVKTVLCPGTMVDATHIRVFVRESLASTVKEGQTVTVSGVGFQNEQYGGIVSSMAKEATVAAGKTGLSAVVTLSSEDTDESLKKGLTAAVRITVSTLPDALVLPREAIVVDESSRFVWIIQDGRTARREVTVTQTVEGGVAVDGLLQGALVIVSPDKVKRAGQRVREETK